MKTGFIHGFPNKPGKKRYSYHGLERDCLIQPDPGPFNEYPTGPALGEWILAWEGPIVTPWLGDFYFYQYDFLPSSDDFLCGPGCGFDKNVYYFTEVEMYCRNKYDGMGLTWSDALNCKYTWIAVAYPRYIYKAWFNIHYIAGQPVWWVFATGRGSYARVWKSKDGEFPGYYPREQKEIIIT